MSGTKNLAVGLDILKKVQLRNGAMIPFVAGEICEIIDTGKTKVMPNGVEFPVYSLGAGKNIDLQTLCNLYIDSEEIKVVNAGTPEECMTRNSQPKLLYTLIEEAGGVLPNKLHIVKRVRAGARKEFLEGERGAVRTVGYSLLGLDTTKEDFPVIVNRADADPKEKESWNFIERVTVTVAE